MHLFSWARLYFTKIIHQVSSVPIKTPYSHDKQLYPATKRCTCEKCHSSFVLKEKLHVYSPLRILFIKYPVSALPIRRSCIKIALLVWHATLKIYHICTHILFGIECSVKRNVRRTTIPCIMKVQLFPFNLRRFFFFFSFQTNENFNWDYSNFSS